MKLGFEGCIGVCQFAVHLKAQRWESIRGVWVTRVGWRGGDTRGEARDEAELSGGRLRGTGFALVLEGMGSHGRCWSRAALA